MFLMLGGVLDQFFKIIQHICQHFIGVSLIGNMLSMYFWNYLFNKIINYTELLLFDIYLTYNLQVIWTSYSEERLVVALVICTNEMDIQTIMVPLICFDGQAIFPDRVMRQFSYRKYIPININMSDALNDITCRDKNDDYDWLGRHNAY